MHFVNLSIVFTMLPRLRPGVSRGQNYLLARPPPDQHFLRNPEFPIKSFLTIAEFE